MYPSLPLPRDLLEIDGEGSLAPREKLPPPPEVPFPSIPNQDRHTDGGPSGVRVIVSGTPRDGVPGGKAGALSMGIGGHRAPGGGGCHSGSRCLKKSP